MSRRTQSAKTQLSGFLAQSRNVFRRQHEKTEMPSVLIAQANLEASVEKGEIDIQDALALINDPASFAELLLTAEDYYQNSEGQKAHKRMAKIERSTHWGVALGLGLTFLAAGPFASALLQPTADELFKRKPAAAQAPATPQPQAVQNITNNTYNFYATEAAPTSTKQSKVTLTCKSMTVTAYKASLSELLQSENVVTLEMNGRKVSMCYRPDVRRTAQQQALVHR